VVLDAQNHPMKGGEPVSHFRRHQGSRWLVDAGFVSKRESVHRHGGFPFGCNPT
jgi:hypothetical protein